MDHYILDASRYVGVGRSLDVQRHVEGHRFPVVSPQACPLERKTIDVDYIHQLAQRLLV